MILVIKKKSAILSIAGGSLLGVVFVFRSMADAYSYASDYMQFQPYEVFIGIIAVLFMLVFGVYVLFEHSNEAIRIAYNKGKIEIPQNNKDDVDTKEVKSSLDDIEVDLEKLKNLFEKNLISKSEYDAKRKKILDL